MRRFTKLAILAVLLLSFVAVATRAYANADAAAVMAPPASATPVAPATAVAPAGAPTPTSGPSLPTNPDPSSRAPDLPKVTPQPARGMRAITPTNLSAAPGAPTFGEQEVRAVALTAGYWPADFRPTSVVTIASIELLTRPQLDARFEHLPAMPNDIFYLLKLEGGFTRPAPDPGGSGPMSQPITSAHLYLLFDARTGNLMMKYQPAGDRDK